MPKSIKYFLVLVVLSHTYLLKAQDSSAIDYSKFRLKVALGNHAVGFPYENLFAAFHPHLSVGTELRLNNNQKHQVFTSANVGFFRNKVIGNTVTMDIDLGYRYLHKKGIFIETALGLGILEQFHPKEIYELNTAADKYEKIKDKGTFASMLGFKMGLGYDFSKQSNRPFSIGISHHFFIQTPYFDVDNFPIMPQVTTNISITYKLRKK